MKYLWKSLKADLRSGHDSSKWKIGVWRKEKEAIKCTKGFHASRNVIHAMGFVNAEVLAQVEVRGKSDIDSDKEAWSEMRIVKAYKWEKKDSVRLAIYAAELVIKIYEKEYPNDDRPRKAIEAAKEWLENPSAATAAAAYAAAAASSASLTIRPTTAAAAYAAAAAAAAAASSASLTIRPTTTAAAYAAAAAAAATTAAAEIREKCAKFVLSILKKKKPLK